MWVGFPAGASGKELACQCRRQKRRGFDPWVGATLWRRAWQLSRNLAWRIPWTEEPGGLQSIGSHRVRHDWSDLAQYCMCEYTHTLLPVSLAKVLNSWPLYSLIHNTLHFGLLLLFTPFHILLLLLFPHPLSHPPYQHLYTCTYTYIYIYIYSGWWNKLLYSV